MDVHFLSFFWAHLQFLWKGKASTDQGTYYSSLWNLFIGVAKDGDVYSPRERTGIPPRQDTPPGPTESGHDLCELSPSFFASRLFFISAQEYTNIIFFVNIDTHSSSLRSFNNNQGDTTATTDYTSRSNKQQPNAKEEMEKHWQRGKGKKQQQQHIDHSALHDQTKEGQNEHHAPVAKTTKNIS